MNRIAAWAGLGWIGLTAAAWAGGAGNTGIGTADYPNGGLRVVGRAAALPGENYFGDGFIDAAAGYAYAVSYGNGSVVKFALGVGDAAPTRVAALTFPGFVVAGAYDPVGGYAYFGVSFGNTLSDLQGRLYKVKLGSGDTAPEAVSWTPLEANELLLSAVAVDSVHGFVYVGTYNYPLAAPARLIKLRMEDGDSTPTRLGSIELDPAESTTRPVVLDAQHGHAYIGASHSDSSLLATPSIIGKLVKVELGSGDALPSVVGRAPVGLGIAGIMLDPTRGFGYYGHAAETRKFILGNGSEVPTILGRACVSAVAGGVDSDSGFAFWGTTIVPPPLNGQTPALPNEGEKADLPPPSCPSEPYGGYIYKMGLGLGPGDPAWAGSLMLPYAVSAGLGLDADRAHTFFAYSVNSGIGPGNISGGLLKVAVSQKGYLKLTRAAMIRAGSVSDISFYSHAAQGNVRISIYDDNTTATRALLWESGPIPNTAAGAWLRVPISSGTPSALALAAGNYLLGWEVDAGADVPSFTPGAMGDGWRLARAFGPAPVSLGATVADEATPEPTNETWSIFLTYTPSAKDGILEMLLGRYIVEPSADANLDGVVDIADYVAASE